MLFVVEPKRTIRNCSQSHHNLVSFSHKNIIINDHNLIPHLNFSYYCPTNNANDVNYFISLRTHRASCHNIIYYSYCIIIIIIIIITLIIWYHNLFVFLINKLIHSNCFLALLLHCCHLVYYYSL